MTNNDMTLDNMVRHYIFLEKSIELIKDIFKDNARSFARCSSADNYTNLNNSMLYLQTRRSDKGSLYENMVATHGRTRVLRAIAQAKKVTK